MKNFLKKVEVFVAQVIISLYKKIKILKGKYIVKKLEVGKTYYNKYKNVYGIYRGNLLFYEQKSVNFGYVEYNSTENVEYTYLQFGLFKDLWKKTEIDFDKDKSEINVKFKV